MKHSYSHEEFTHDMFERVNANHQEALERNEKKTARAEWKRLLRKRDGGVFRAFGACAVAALAFLTDCAFAQTPDWLVLLVMIASGIWAVAELVLAIRRAPAIVAAYKKKEGKNE